MRKGGNSYKLITKSAKGEMKIKSFASENEREVQKYKFTHSL